jgi:hypothetical protein
MVPSVAHGAIALDDAAHPSDAGRGVVEHAALGLGERGGQGGAAVRDLNQLGRPIEGRPSGCSGRRASAPQLDFGQKFNGLAIVEAQNKGRVNFFTVTAKPRQ